MGVKVLKDKSYGNITISMLSKIVAIIAYFGSDIVCARILPLQDYASWIYYTSIKTMLAYMAYFGLNTSTKVIIARTENENEKLECLKASIRIRAMINILFAVIITCFSQFMAIKLDSQNKYPNFSAMFWAMGLLVLLESFFEFYKQLSYGLNNYKLLLQVNCLEFGSNLMFTFLFLIVWKSIFGVLWATAISGMIAFFSCTLLVKKRYAYSTQKMDKKKERSIQKQLLKYAFPLLACDIANLITLELDTSMIGYLSGEEQVAFYNIGKKLVSKAGHVNLAIASGIMTSFAVINSKNITEQSRRFKKFFGINLTAAICVCFGLLFLALGGVKFIYGQVYSGAQKIIFLLIPYYIMFAVSTFLALFLDFQGKTTFRSIISILSILLNFMLNYIFIPQHGAIGATATTLVSQMVYFCFTCFASINVWRQYRKQYKKDFSL